MAKGKLNKTQLEEERIRLTDEIKKLKNIIKASDTATFEIMINDIKEEMLSNVKEEDWKTLKTNKSKVEAFRDIVKILQNQDELLQQKQDQLEDIIYEIEHYQPTLFEDQEESNPENPKATFTGIFINEEELRVGDIFCNETDEMNIQYYLIKHSSEMQDKFAILTNYADEELLLQYPYSQHLISEANYIGNFYLEDECTDETIAAMNSIAEFNKLNSN